MKTIGIVEDDRLLNDAWPKCWKRTDISLSRPILWRRHEAYPAEAGTDHSGY